MLENIILHLTFSNYYFFTCNNLSSFTASTKLAVGRFDPWAVVCWLVLWGILIKLVRNKMGGSKKEWICWITKPKKKKKNPHVRLKSKFKKIRMRLNRSNIVLTLPSWTLFHFGNITRSYGSYEKEHTVSLNVRQTAHPDNRWNNGTKAIFIESWKQWLEYRLKSWVRTSTSSSSDQTT